MSRWYASVNLCPELQCLLIVKDGLSSGYTLQHPKTGALIILKSYVLFLFCDGYFALHLSKSRQ